MKGLLLGISLALAALLLTASGCIDLDAPKLNWAREFTLHKNFGDHMVLQQGRPIQISGTGTPDSHVVVSLGDRRVFAYVGGNGEWEAVFPAMQGGYEAYSLTVSGAEDVEPLVISDVVVGEVWFCGGQSNMEMPLWTSNAAWRNYDGDKEVRKGLEQPYIRLFNGIISRGPSSYKLLEEPKGCWELPSESGLSRFSAVAFFFGQELQRRLDVPIGLIESCWSGTKIEPWIGEAAFKANQDSELDYCRGLLKKLDDPNRNNLTMQQIRNLWLDDMNAQHPVEKAAAIEWSKDGYEPAEPAWVKHGDRAGQEVRVPNTELAFSWLVKYVELPQEWTGKELKLHFGFIDDVDDTYFNGTLVGTTNYDNDAPNVAERNYVIPAGLARPGMNYIAIRLCNSNGVFGGIGKDRYVAMGDSRLALDDGWYSRLEAICDGTKSNYTVRPEMEAPNSVQFPSALYNSMVYPWGRFPVRGVIWYQGEANASNEAQYAKLFTLMTKCWRETWMSKSHPAKAAPAMPFIYCQLSGYGPGQNWPRFRRMQEKLLATDPAFGMAVTMDKGDEKDIHPHDKKPVGLRLAAEAMRLCYGSAEVSHGPYFRAAHSSASSRTMMLAFDGAGSGLASLDGKPLAGFEAAGADGVFVPAQATVVGTDRVSVESNGLTAIKYVRYAWAPYCGEMNFGNAEGFPAAPFNTMVP